MLYRGIFKLDFFAENNLCGKHKRKSSWMSSLMSTTFVLFKAYTKSLEVKKKKLVLGYKQATLWMHDLHEIFYYLIGLQVVT